VTPHLRPHPAAYRASAESRLGGLLFALTMVALLLLMLIRMGAFPGKEPSRGSRLVAVSFSESQPAAAAAKAAAPVHERTMATTPLPLVPPPRAIVALQPKPAIVAVSSTDFAASDISKLGKGSGASSGSGKPVYGPGEGPGGVQLFPAEWVREPTDAELVTYLPSRGVPPGAWATIACQTIERFHVENCQPLDEAPLGSGLSRGLRNAAWQFLVRPPRNGGQYQVGTWVRIRFTFSRPKGSAASETEADGG
jgi:protein TonB